MYFGEKQVHHLKQHYFHLIKTNFTIINKKTGQRVPFAIRTYTGKIAEVGQENLGKLGFRVTGRRTDEVILLSPHPTIPDSLLPGWQISFLLTTTTGCRYIKA